MSDKEDFERAIAAGGGTIRVLGRIGVFRRAKALAGEDGRAWEYLTAEAMDRYIALAAQSLASESESVEHKP